MPICLKCQISFPNRKVVDGKPRNLSSRKFCLKCSPYQSKKRRNLVTTAATFSSEISEVSNKHCLRCNQILPASAFYTKGSGRLTPYCKTCTVDQVTERQKEFKRKNVEYKGGKCQLCGYGKCLAALEFHHLDPTKKDLQISYHRNSSFESIKEELDKCVLVCSNCHREIHSGLINLTPLLGIEPRFAC